MCCVIAQKRVVICYKQRTYGALVKFFPRVAGIWLKIWPLKHFLNNYATHLLYDISEFIEKYFACETKALNAKITYHDPCHLYWGQNISKQPRDILKRSSTFQEMETPERCCGGGGVFNLLHYDLSMKIGEYKARAIEKSGAEVVATGCPGCRLQIEDLLAAKGSPVKCAHTIQVLRDAMLSPTK